MTDFEIAVASVLNGLEAGDVMTYGEVAQQAGYSVRASRSVGGFLARSDGRFPWWRVVTADGRLVPGNESEHSRLLRAEGIDVVNGYVAALRPTVRR